MGGEELETALQLADWRRRVADLYARVRATPTPAEGWTLWVEERARLFLHHPQSPIPAPARTAENLPRYFDYDESMRVVARLEAVEPQPLMLPGSRDETFGASRVGRARFALDGEACSVDAYWLDGYAGGLYISVRDTTSGVETYGAGRYVIDGAKGADLGASEDGLVIDFNFAYQPSCSYDPRWSCPLAPPQNRLGVALRAGERLQKTLTGVPTSANA